MRRKIVLAVLLCLATAALGIGAAPALAADGCTCHTVEPPTATAAHAPLVVGVTDCTTCHKGWAVPHPELVVPSLTLTNTGGGLFGRFVAKAKGINGVVVYLQQRLWGETAFTDLTQVTTQTHIMVSARGWFHFPMQHPTPWAAYRAVSEGVAGPPVVVPGKRVWRPKPTLTLKMGGPVPLASIFASGRARPLKLAGEEVNFTVHKLKAGKWVTVKTGAATITAKGTYKWSLGVGHGSFRTRAAISGTVNHRPVRTAWRYYKF